MPPLLSIKNLCVAYDAQTVVHDISIDFESGRFIGLIGPNGAGKTTFMLSVSGQFHPKAGTILFDGKNIYDDNFFYKKHIGYVHETPFFYEHLTVEEFLIFVARLKGVEKSTLFAHVEELLVAVRLQQEKQKLTLQLSQGMRKKLAIAAAFVNSPKILFLDEALNGIDVESAFHIKNLLVDFVKDGGTVVLSTHVLEVIEKICDRYIILKSGRIIADVNAHNFKSENADLEHHVLSLLRDET